MRLVVAVEDHFAVSCEHGCEGFPEGLKTGVVGYDIAVVAPEVVRVNDGVHAFGVGDVVHDAG